MKITYRSNIKEIVGRIEAMKDSVADAKVKGLSDIAQAAFGQVAEKYIVQGQYVKGKEYQTPPGANIEANKQIVYNPKTGYRKVKKVLMFVLGKVVSRTQAYEKQIKELAKLKFSKGSQRVGEIRVDIDEDSIKIFAVSNSETYFLETRKQAGKSAIRPIFKAFRSAVNIWRKVRVNLGKK